MKVLLITPSNLLFMPYVQNYIEFMALNNIDHVVVSWDRLNVTENVEYVFQDSEKGHSRSTLDYIRYVNYVKKVTKLEKPNKIIIFGIQLYFFMQFYLYVHYKGNIIVDIRDYHKLFKLVNKKVLISSSEFIAISSDGFRQWLPTGLSCKLNHNIRFNHSIIHEKVKKKSNKIIVSYIGTIVRYNENISIIDSLANSETIELHFIGDGIINEQISSYVKKHLISNVKIMGRYQKEDEMNLYISSDMINTVVHPDNINNRTSTSNRFYNAILHGKPLLGFKDTFVSELIDEYSLGLIIEDYEDLGGKIKRYFDNFDQKLYDKNRSILLTRIQEDNDLFHYELKKFLQRK